MPKSKERTGAVVAGNTDRGLGWLLSLGQLIGLLGLLVLGSFMLGGRMAQAWLLSLPLLSLLLVLMALNGWWRGYKGGMEVRVPALWFLPFLAWVTFQLAFNSPASWLAWQSWGIWITVWLVFWMVLHFRENLLLHQWFGLGLLCLVLLVILASYNQALRSPQAMPLYRDLLGLGLPDSVIRNAYPGQPTGAFADPYQLGTFLVLAFFGMLLPALRSSFPFVLRLFLGYLALMCLPLIFWTGSPGAWLALVAGLFLLPWLVYDTLRSRIFAVTGVVATCMIGGTIIYVLTVWGKADASQSALLSDEVLRYPVLWQAAWQAGMEHWLAGNGLGQFPFYFEIYRPEGMAVDPLHASNFYLTIWADMGLIGFIALFLPVGYMVVLIARFHSGMPWLRKLGSGRSKRFQVSQGKLLTATFLLLAWVLFVDQWASDLTGAPVLLLFIVAGTAFVLRTLPPREWKFPLNSFPGKAIPALFLLLAFVLPLLQFGRLWGMVQAEEGQRRLHAFSGDFHKVQEKTWLLELTIEMLQQAVDSYPGQGSAWSDLSSATAHLRFLSPEDRIGIAILSEQQARQAINLLPSNVWAWIHLGNALWLQDRMEEANQAYEQAIELAPNHGRAWFHYASFLRTQRGRQTDAMIAVERALILDPGDPDVLALKRRLLIP